MSAESTFMHRFRNGIVCTMTVSATAGIVSASWTRKPSMSRRFVQEYVRWQKSILDTVANESGRSIAQLIQVGPTKFITIIAEPNNQTNNTNDQTSEKN